METNSLLMSTTMHVPVVCRLNSSIQIDVSIYQPHAKFDSSYIPRYK